MCAIFRDEGAYLDEWLTFHHAVGVEHFVLYNNNSQDGYREVLKPWIAKDLVTLCDWSKSQHDAYNHCLSHYRLLSKWVAFIDLDEFLFSPANRDLRTVLAQYQGYAGVFVHWRLFGSAGHQTRPEGSVIDNYTRCLDLEAARSGRARAASKPLSQATRITGNPCNGKSIVNPRLVGRVNAHRPDLVYSSCVVNERKESIANQSLQATNFTCDVLRINHYWSKSLQDLDEKVRRKCAWRALNGWPPVATEFTVWRQWEEQCNACQDTTLLNLWNNILSDQAPRPRSDAQ